MKMGYIRQRKGRWTVEIKKRRGHKIYENFTKKSDALRFMNETETMIQQNKYRDVSEASKTSLRVVLYSYLREIVKDKKEKRRERSKYNVILRNDILSSKLGYYFCK